MVTIKEIARAVGVSPATVSRVLNYDQTLSITAAKRQAIIETAESLNYLTPRNRNRTASATFVAPNGTARVALVHSLKPIEELADPYYVGVRLGIEHRSQALRLDCTKVCLADGMADPALLAGAAGIIAVGTHRPEEVAWLQRMTRNLVFADVCPPIESCDRVESDLGIATDQLLDALFDLGYRRIAFIGGADTRTGRLEPFAERRCAAYRAWMERRGLADPALCRVGQIRFEDGYGLTATMLDEGVRPEVVVAANDNMAIGAYRAIQERGLRIPDDIGVVGFNDIPAAQFLSPPLTTIRIHAERIGEIAVDLAGELIGGRDYYKKVVISTELIWRDSCRSPVVAVTG
ncbi:LacI family DNA-binding transcriptional regulator [Prosthecomicrobium pneumaticum]|uniref:LacI family transcriptional regulator n=1 Tax=Prosthecomicrobium pneumaticum TaxID=81895 RepID=A0A7W9L1Q0_9HYPH|nr:LacI family DNA-binding transcriptional regulator [Prosthecomicrobium pneumaticum]MBB5752901.1 LacI family transcriptional regulator [Prosthecomicrobium pneumaticum]